MQFVPDSSSELSLLQNDFRLKKKKKKKGIRSHEVRHELNRETPDPDQKDTDTRPAGSLAEPQQLCGTDDL